MNKQTKAQWHFLPVWFIYYEESSLEDLNTRTYCVYVRNIFILTYYLVFSEIDTKYLVIIFSDNYNNDQKILGLYIPVVYTYLPVLQFLCVFISFHLCFITSKAYEIFSIIIFVGRYPINYMYALPYSELRTISFLLSDIK